MMLDELQKSLPVKLPGDLLTDEVAVFGPLRPAGTKQEEIEFQRAVRLPILRRARRVTVLFLHVLKPPAHSHTRYITGIEVRRAVAGPYSLRWLSPGRNSLLRSEFSLYRKESTIFDWLWRE